MLKVYLSLICKVFFDIAVMLSVVYCVVQWLVGMDIVKLFNIM